MASLRALLLALVPIIAAQDINFSFEAAQLTEKDIQAFPLVAPGNVSTGAYTGPRCRVGPDDSGWPSDSEWAAFNASLGGKLLKPLPPAAVCYKGPLYDAAKCVLPAAQRPFSPDDPLTVETTFAAGSSCMASAANTSAATCQQGGYPTFVINATTARDVQMGINFARNKNLRLNIKNTGHDFVGRSTGKGALSIWVHYMKGLQLRSNYTTGKYKGHAAVLGAGTQSYEVFNAMVDTGNLTILSIGTSTVGLTGWAMGGGHTILASTFGLGADQLLSLNVVTADGTFVTANSSHNQDLFYALRGGGGSTFGVVTSAIVKAYPEAVSISGTTFALATGPVKPATLTSYSPFPVTPAISVPNATTFRQAFARYLSFAPGIAVSGGFGYGDLQRAGNDSYTFVGSFVLPRKTASEAEAALKPFFDGLRTELGLTDLQPKTQTLPYATRRTADVPFDAFSRVFSSRLFPRAVFENATRVTAIADALWRATVEDGLFVRCRNFAPSTAAGNAGANPGTDPPAISSAFRNSGMHLTVYAPGDIHTPAEFVAQHDVALEPHMRELRALTPGSGAYFNEADVREPDWQASFFGDTYERLLKIKKAVDPWGLFWAPTTAGSEAWAVQSDPRWPAQDGPLCKTAAK